MKSIQLNSTHTKSNLMVLISALAILLFSSAKINAQSGNLQVTTETHINGKAFKGYMITVYEDFNGNGDFSPIDQFMCNSSKQHFNMKYNAAYMLDFATPADLHYTVQFDTHMSDAMASEKREFEIDIDFNKLDINEYPNTVEMVSFNDNVQDFAFKTLMDAKVQQANIK